MGLQIIEKDETGTIISQYDFDVDSQRIVKKTPISAKGKQTIGLDMLAEMFLPAGYPASVTPGEWKNHCERCAASTENYPCAHRDYTNYQIYDSLQAFSSSIAGLLSSRAVLEGIGVGDQSATATNAMILTVVQDMISRVVTILFAWRLGTALEPEAKMYRLAADVFNDIAILTDCLSPALPQRLRIFGLCLSGSLRALCGVAAGGSKAALSIHFSKSGNVGELNAKDSSQETVIGLLGMLCGSLVLRFVTSRTATWVALIFLLVVHLGTNYLAVRSVVMTTLNRQRANIVYEQYRKTGHILSPLEASRLERIFDYDGAIRESATGSLLGKCEIGPSCSAIELFSGKSVIASSQFAQSLVEHKYFIWSSKRRTSGCFRPQQRIIYVFPGSNASSADLLRAWLHAFELARLLKVADESLQEASVNIAIQVSATTVNNCFGNFLGALKEAGWNTVNTALVTRALHTVTVEEDKKSL